jgi:succinate dehydrogenase/fumarate reductase cytochrome b subunit
MKIFGREPAAVLAFVSILVKLGSAYVFHATQTQQATVNTVAACVVALAIAFVAHDAMGAAVFNLAQALVAAAVGFGLKLDADHQALWLSLVTVVIGLWSRTQITAKTPGPAAAKHVASASTQVL